MDTAQDLRGRIAEHTVRYEVWPHYDVVGRLGMDARRVIDGFDLELHGTHQHGHTFMTPGCELCHSTYQDLRRIADDILPTEQRPSEYEILPFDCALHSTAGRREMEVVVTIRIRHRQEYFAPIDGCEERCLREMEAHLLALGVARGHGAQSSALAHV